MAKINYEALSERVCCYCKENYKPTGPAQKCCTSCHKLDTNITRQVSADMERMKKFGTYCEIGKGKAQGLGENSPFWRGGLVLSPRIKRTIKASVKFCERCGRDLTEAGQWEWCVHHLDRDKTNQQRSNLILLCKRCHQIEHDCISHLRTSNDHPEEEYTCSQVEAVSSPIGADDMV